MKLMSDGETADLTLIYEPAGWEHVVHSQLLGSRSEVFRKIVINMKQSSTRLRNIKLINSQCGSAELDAFVSYLYGCELELEFCAEKLIILADYYAVVDLKEECERSLIISLCSENITCRIVLSDTYSMCKLYKICVRMLTQDKKLFTTDEWKCFEKKHKRLCFEIVKQVACETTNITFN